MWPRMREVLTGALTDFSACWRTLAIADLAYKALAFAVFTPATLLFVRWMLIRTGTNALADAEIARFFFTTWRGILALLLGGAMAGAIAALEAGCLMAIGVSVERGRHMAARGALSFGVREALPMLGLALQMVVRAIALVLPFLLAIGAVYFALLRGHDINYYLSHRPPVFLLAVVLAGVIVAVLAVLAVRMIVRWALSLPLVLFENVPPRHALRESALRSRGNGWLIALVLGIWAVVASVLGAFPAWLVDATARKVAPAVSGSLTTLILFLAVAAIVWAALSLAIGIINISLFSLLIVRLWLHAGDPAVVHLPAVEADPERERRVSRILAFALAAIGVFAAAGFALLAFVVTHGSAPALVIAHRGSSQTAPENTLASFRQAVRERADVVELDVQESLDGQVLVIHDSDLMKVGGSPMKIWEHTAAELRTVDIGSFKGKQFSGERVPTLAEALAVCKGSSRVLIELKSYGHDQQLEQRVAEIVEAAGMADRCAFMSLNRNMVAKMKNVRPSWRVGLLLTKAIGDPAAFGADFLAVATRAADVRFLRRAHRAGKDVYVWTLNDPSQMLSYLGRGADGMITDNPVLGRQVMERRRAMSDAQRLLVALLLRAGERAESLQSEAALRP